jgi:DNA-binding protein HU-beta
LLYFSEEVVVRMTKVELTEHIAKQAGISRKAATKVLDVFVGSVHEALRGKNKKMRVAKLGTFRVIHMKARNGVNPRTLKKMTIPAMALPRFTPSMALKEAIRNAK